MVRLLICICQTTESVLLTFSINLVFYSAGHHHQQQQQHHHQHSHSHQQQSSQSSQERSKSSQPLLSTSIASALPLTSTRTHSHSGMANSLQAFGHVGLHLPSPGASTPSTQSIIGASTAASTVHSSQTIIPSKYEFTHSPLIHGGESHLTNNNIAAAAANNSNSTNYIPSQLAYGSVKSEANASSFDYMNNCLQNGYFNGSFGALSGTAPTTTSHSVADLAGYHHQHNVIQAAKLMATS